MPIIHIDNQSYEVKAGKNLLEACLGLGLDLPYFCWHPALGSVGACRQCAVKIYRDEADTRGKLVMSCMEPVRDGLRLSITDTTAKAFREQIIEWLMTNHPHDCPVCDEGGSCHLQDMTVMTGHDYRRYDYKKRTYRSQYLGPLIHHEMNRCIQCYRCVRYYHDYAGGDDLNVYAAHNHVYFGREKDGVLESPFSGNLVEVCPTGVFTDKTLKEHYTRKWDLTMAPSVCTHCGVGCNTIAGERYGEVRCVLNRYNSAVNGYFLCDRGRFGYEFVNSENRVRKPIIRNRVSEAANEGELDSYLKSVLMEKTLIGIGSPRASVESNFALRQLVGEANFYAGVNETVGFLSRKIVQVFQSGVVHSASLKDIEQSDAVLVLGEDIWNTAPMMAMAVRQSVMKTAATDASQHTSLPSWHDAALKELVQEQKGFLALATITRSPLHEIASNQFFDTPDGIARLGFAIAHQLNSSLPPVNGANDELLERASSIANALANARRPVIVSGISCRSESVIKAAFDIAASLDTAERKAGLAYALPDCNSMGLAMMQASSFEKAAERLQREKDATVIIIENDVYRYMPPLAAEAFFNRCKHLVVLDSLNTATTEKAHAIIPAATFAEGDGTLVNNEGRAQRYFQVFVSSNTNIQDSWKWLWKMQLLKTGSSNGQVPYPEELLQALESQLSQFNNISRVSPPHDFTIHGERIPREPHRYSGRTAMHAHLNVSEPKPLYDDDSALTFTMEGYKGLPPSSMTPFYWAPGWNSVQSLTKYQKEPGGTLKDGDPGIPLFNVKTGVTPEFFHDIPEAFSPRQNKWLVLPQYDVLASGEFSSYTKGIRELSKQPYVFLSAADAKKIDALNDAILTIRADENEYELPVKISNELKDGILLVSGMEGINWGGWVEIGK